MKKNKFTLFVILLVIFLSIREVWIVYTHANRNIPMEFQLLSYEESLNYRKSCDQAVRCMQHMRHIEILEEDKIASDLSLLITITRPLLTFHRTFNNDFLSLELGELNRNSLILIKNFNPETTVTYGGFLPRHWSLSHLFRRQSNLGVGITLYFEGDEIERINAVWHETLR